MQSRIGMSSPAENLPCNLGISLKQLFDYIESYDTMEEIAIRNIDKRILFLKKEFERENEHEKETVKMEF